MKKLFTALAVVAATISFTSSAGAITCFGLTDTNHLLTFDSATPGTVTDVSITGLPGGSEMAGLALRITTQPSPSNPGVGTMWGLVHDGTHYKLFVVSTAGVATQVGGILSAMDAASASVGDSAWGFAFNPATDRFQAVGVNFNFTIDPNTVTAVRDADVFTAGSMNPAFSGAAFTTTSFGGTTQYYIANCGENHNLCTSTNIAAGGLISEAGVTNWGVMGFSQADGLAISGGITFLGASDGKFYSVARSTGTATLIGPFPGAADMRSIVIQPSSFPVPFTTTAKIKGPKKVTTTATSKVIKGTATSGAGITLVQYKVGKGKFKTAKGTTNWKFTAKLKPGTNKISVQATGGNGVKSAVAKVTVVVSE